MNISVFGIGLMGTPIATRLLHQGHRITLYNRTPKDLTDLQTQGAIVASTTQEAVDRSPIMVLTLSDAQAIRDTLLKPGIDLSGKTIIQMGTIAPQESQDIAKTIQNLGADYLEAPVLGSIPEAKAGTLLIFVGASELLFNRMLPILQDLGETPRHIFSKI